MFLLSNTWRHRKRLLSLPCASLNVIAVAVPCRVQKLKVEKQNAELAAALRREKLEVAEIAEKKLVYAQDEAVRGVIKLSSALRYRL